MLGRKKTVDSVLSTFSKAIAELEEVQERSYQESVEKNLEAQKLVAEAEAAHREMTRAEVVRERLLAIVS